MKNEKDLTKVKSKLQKLMRALEGAKAINSEGEANAAAAAIQRILMEYNLTMGDIEKESEKKDFIKESIMSCYRFKSIGGDWEFRLMSVICKWNLCKCFRYGETKHRKMAFFGKEENIETVKWLYDLLCNRFVSFGKNRYKSYQHTEEYIHKSIGLDTFLRRYLEGCAKGLDLKFAEEDALNRKAEEEYGAKVNALIVRNDRAVIEYVSERYGRATTGRAMPTAKRDSSFAMGVVDGKNTQIHKQVGESKNNQVNSVKLLK